MRTGLIALLVLVAACQQQEAAGPPSKAAEISFDGAAVIEPAALASHGERLTWTLGCRGCHEANLQGHRFYERYASNLTRELPKYSDADIERVLRTGVPRDGRELWGMPSEIFQHLSEADMKALIADLRTLETAGKPTEPPRPWEADAKELIAKGEIKDAKDTVAQESKLSPVDLGQQYALGRYITRVTCAECHGPELKGSPLGPTPNLVVAGGYSRAEFETLMTKGIPSGGRKLDLMHDVAVERFTHFTPHERDALYAYLKARAEQPSAN
jgi:cytochrome c553